MHVCYVMLPPGTWQAVLVHFAQVAMLLHVTPSTDNTLQLPLGCSAQLQYTPQPAHKKGTCMAARQTNTLWYRERCTCRDWDHHGGTEPPHAGAHAPLPPTHGGRTACNPPYHLGGRALVPCRQDLLSATSHGTALALHALLGTPVQLHSLGHAVTALNLAELALGREP